jgi:hypothetical protein
MKILIVSSHFPPLNSIASLRPYSWAKYWAALGHDITVLTTRKPHSDNRLDADLSFLTLLEVPIPGVGLLRRFDDPASRSGAVRVDHEAPEGHWRLANRLNAIRRKRGLFMSARMPDHHDLWIRPALGNLCRIVHTGTIYQGKRGPSSLFEAMRRLADTVRLAEQYGVADLFEDEGFIGAHPQSIKAL